MIGFLGFVLGDEEKIVRAEGAFAPDELGRRTLHYLRPVGSADALTTMVRRLRLLSVGEAWPDEDAERVAKLRAYLDRRPMELLKALAFTGVAEDAWHVPSCSGDVPWGYVVDLDRKVYEVYEGLQQAEHSDGRFASRARLRRMWQPVRLAARFPLSELPDNEEFLIAIRDGARTVSWPTT